ncbi:MAG: amino acid adenylation domain-containing protein [Acidobacteriota bacterium]|nr:amino acid adenylation domain-containing protein [Acidobacteriota bacterium]
MTTNSIDVATTYWRRKRDALQTSGLGTPQPPSGRRGEHTIAFGDGLANALARASNGSDASTYLLLAAPLATLLSCYTDSDEIAFSAPPFALRPAGESPVFFRQTIAAGTTFLALLDAMRGEMEEIVRHQEWAERDERAIHCALILDGFHHATRADFPIAFTCDRHRILVTWDAAAFDSWFIEQLADDYVATLRELLRDARQPAAVPISDVQSHDTIVSRFEAQARRTPNAIAVTYEERSLTYAELDARANAIASWLAAHHQTKPEDIVALLLDRSEWLVITILGILKSGAAYLPIDPSYPRDRVEHMLRDSNAKVLLTEEKFLENFPGVDVHAIEGDPAYASVRGTRDDLAYVIYTSGSTGLPKGVLITHSNVLSLMDAGLSRYRYNETDVWSLFHSVAFDFSVWELWGALLFGGRLVIVPYLVSRTPSDFYDLIARERVTVMNQTPSAFRQFDLAEQQYGQKPLALRYVIFGGEALDLSSLRGWFERHGDRTPLLVNMYGITETTVHTTYRALSAADLESGSVIGDALEQWSVVLLNRRGEPVPRGVTGEIYVGGAGVARGYLNRPELNAFRFIEHPRFGRLYRSGDLARRIENGELEHLGRIDHQVKIRGFRIELGEIEQRLMEHAAVPDAAVLPHGTGDEQELVAYLFECEGVTARELRKSLARTLPVYMVPARFVFVPTKRPLTSNGKLDRRQLDALVESSAAPAPQIAPPSDDPLVRRLSQLWQEVLGRPVSADESFFDLGGHSLKAASLISHMHRELEVEVSLADLFHAPSIAQFAELIRTRARTPLDAITPVAVAEHYELSHAQRRMWLLAQMDDGHGAYHMPAAFTIRGPLDAERLERAIEAVVARHESLLTRFIAVGEEPRQFLEERIDVAIERRSAATMEEARAAIAADAARPFDLTRAPLFRVALWRVDDDLHVLAVNLHHIVADGWSVAVLANDVAAAYRGETLVPLALQSKDFAAWQNARDEHGDRAYWHERLSGEIEPLRIPTSRPRPAVQSFAGASLTLRLDSRRTAALRELASKEQTSLFGALVAVVKALLFCYTRQQDVIVGAPVAGRGRAELDEQIGFFVNTVALRDAIDGAATLRTLLRAVGVTVAEAVDHQAYPFDRLVEELTLRRDAGRSPLFDVMVLLQDGRAAALALEGCDVAPLPLDFRVAKFDLTFEFTEHDDELELEVEYATALFDADRIEQLLADVATLIDTDPTTPLDALPIVAPPSSEGSDEMEVEIEQPDARPETLAWMLDTWRELLGDDELEPDDDFFESGGHSLKAARLVARIEHERGAAITLRDVFANPTARRLAARIDFAQPSTSSAIPVLPDAPHYALSHAQHRLWVLDRLDPRPYHIAGAWHVDGELDVVKLERALNAVVQRHESLRTTFEVIDGEPRQRVHASLPVALEVIETSDVEALLRGALAKPFDLARGPLLRAALLRERGEQVLFFDIHHIVTDGSSLALFARELLEVYGGASARPPLRLQYRDVAAWQNALDLDDDARYWKTQLDGLERLDLPADFARPAVPSFDGATATFALDAAPLHALARSRNTTLFAVLTAALKAVLHRYTDQQDIAIGTSVAGRTHAELEEQLGLFVNTLVLRDRVAADDSFVALLDRVSATLVDAQQHQSLPFDRLVDDLAPMRDVSRAPLIDVFAVLQNHDAIDLRPHGFSELPFDPGVSKFDLSLFFEERDGTLRVSVEYATALFTSERMIRFCRHFETLLCAAAAEPSLAITDLPLMPDDERAHIASFERGPAASEPIDVLQRFEAIVAAQRDDVALVTPTESITYGELDARASALARELTEGALAGLRLGRSERAIVAMLAALKAGAPFLPIDPELPAARTNELRNLCSIVLEEDGSIDRRAASHAVIPDGTAYILFTSGSTGEPKGCCLTRRNLAAYLDGALSRYDFARGDFSLFTSLSFDLTLTAIFVPLLRGRTLHLFGDLPVAELLRKTFDPATAVDAVKITPAHIALLPHLGLTSTNVATAIVGGEALLPSHLATLRALNPSMRIYNEYGPTETTVGCVVKEILPGDARIVIGRPLRHTKLRIADARLQPVPIGITGELLIGGSGVGAGYLDRDDLTAERFVTVDGERYYRSGDYGRWCDDGNVESLGRRDEQIKLRGHRIELAEIEQQLARIAPAAVAIVNGELIAWVAGEVDEPQLREHALATLPSYMVPSRFVVLDAMPLTPHGKIDRRALPAPPPRAASGALTTPTQHALAAIWRDLLGLTPGADDNFFRHGGNSITAIQALARIAGDLGADVPVARFFASPSLAELAAFIDAQAPRRALDDIAHIPDAPDYAVSHGQHRLWVLAQMSGSNAAYNVPAALSVRGAIDLEAVRRALDALVARHESLRTTFALIGSELRQRVMPIAAAAFSIIDAQHLAHDAVTKLIEEDAAAPFDLERGPLFRVTALRTANDETILLFNAHHIVVDAWSMSVLTRDFAALYAGEMLEPLSLQYRDFATWQNARTSDGAEASAFWRERLANLSPLDLPADHPRPPVRSFAGARHATTLPRELASRVHAVARERATTPFVVLTAAVKALLRRYSGQDDIVIGTPISGRSHPALESQVGLFINMLVLRDRVGGTFAELLDRVAATTAEAFEREVPFDVLVDALPLQRDPSRSPLFDVQVSLQNAPPLAPIAGLDVTAIAEHIRTSKYDLSFLFVPEEEALTLHLEYSTDLFTAARIERMARHFETLLADALEHLDADVAALELLPPDERAQIEEWGRGAEAPATANLLDLFREMVRVQPDAIAIRDGERALAYAQLDDAARAFAKNLHGPIALGSDRSIEAVVAMLGALEAGVPWIAGGEVEGASCPPSTAYVLYTSGSTGEPKGCVVSVANLTSYVTWAARTYPAGDYPLFTSLAFDLTLTSIFVPLLTGRTIHLFASNDVASVLAAIFDPASAIDTVKLTPSHIALLAELPLAQTNVATAIVGGEALRRDHVDTLRRLNPAMRIFNEYGPTEATVGCVMKEIADEEQIVVGKPIDDARIRVVDERLHDVPVGVAGEILIGGNGVAIGYRGNDELTRERFLEIDGERFYRSGDYAVWSDDGNLDYRGRRDHQVKIRGHRVELGAIEAVIASHESVREAAVLFDGERLTAYVAGDSDLAQLHDELRSALPPHMLPSRIVIVDALPLTSNGKVDRKALAESEGRELAAAAYVAPATDAERVLAEVWSEVLALPKIGTREHFFHVGGDSIRAIQIVSRLAARQWKLDVATLFRYPTIAELAPQLVPLARQIEQTPATGEVPLTPIQSWFFEQSLAAPHHYNQSVVLRAPHIDENALRIALRALLAQHDALRTRFRESQFIEAHDEPSLELFASLEEAARLQESLDLARGPLMRAGLVRATDGDRLVMVIHHLVVDGVSWRILLADLQTAYEQALRGDDVRLDPRSDSVQTWSRALGEWSSSAALLDQIPLWRRIENDAAPLPPRDRNVDRADRTTLRTQQLLLTPSRSAPLLGSANAAYNTNSGELLVTALAMACHRWYGASRVRLALESHGREPFGPALDLGRTVGWFTSLHPVLVEMKRPGDLGYDIRFVKETLRAIPHGGIGYGVLRYLTPPELRADLTFAAQPRIAFNYLGQFDDAASAFAISNESAGEELARTTPLLYDLDVSAVANGGVLRVRVDYSSARHDDATIAAFLRFFDEALDAIATHCTRQTATIATPSDFTLRDLTIEELDGIFADGGAA